MLKTRLDSGTWLVHQPDHARVSGYLAAHWGNGEFSRPGSFAPSPNPDAYRDQVIHAIAEHDNGWWEWEAAPEFDPADGLPLHLPDVARTTEDAGLRRWRLGVPRFRESRPYSALLISLHSYWLYAFAFDDLPDRDDALRHPLFGQADSANRLVNAPEATRAFLREQAGIQRDTIDRLRADEVLAPAVEREHLLPHLRLLQLADALSLLLSFGGDRALSVADVPRRSWDDRVALTWRPDGDRRIVCSPFPFDSDPLEVFLPVRVVSGETAGDGLTPVLRLHSTPLKTVPFRVCSG